MSIFFLFPEKLGNIRVIEVFIFLYEPIRMEQFGFERPYNLFICIRGR